MVNKKGTKSAKKKLRLKTATIGNIKETALIIQGQAFSFIEEMTINVQFK